MKIPQNCKIQEVASQVTTRYAISGVYYDPKERAVVATNGRVLAIVPVESTDETPKSVLSTPQSDSPVVDKKEAEQEAIISLDAIKSAQKSKNRGILLIEGDKCKTLDGLTYPNIEGKFPVWREVVPDISQDSGYDIKIGINAKYLYQLAKALGDDKLCLTIKVEKNTTTLPYYVTPITEDLNLGQYGVLMPCKAV